MPVVVKRVVEPPGVGIEVLSDEAQSALNLLGRDTERSGDLGIGVVSEITPMCGEDPIDMLGDWSLGGQFPKLNEQRLL